MTVMPGPVPGMAVVAGEIMKAQSIKFRPVAPHCGAEVHGINLAEPLDETTVVALNEALPQYGVLFFRDPVMTAEQLMALGRCFGELHIHPAWPRLVDNHPEVMEIFADENTKRIAGETWHSDVSCDPEPPRGTILQVLEVPPVGGDTLFANMCAVFESLSASMQRFLEGLTALHDGETTYRGRYDGAIEEGKTYPQSVHPVVRTVDGHQALFVNRTFTTRIVELGRQESDAMLRLLFQHVEQPEYQCRFQWQPGSVAFWDNRCTQHHALWDYYPHRRVGQRVTIQGNAPYFRPNETRC